MFLPIFIELWKIDLSLISVPDHEGRMRNEVVS